MSELTNIESECTVGKSGFTIAMSELTVILSEHTNIESECTVVMWGLSI